MREFTPRFRRAFLTLIACLGLGMAPWATAADLSFRNQIPDNSVVRRAFMEAVQQPITKLSTIKTQIVHDDFMPGEVQVEARVNAKAGYTSIWFRNRQGGAFTDSALGTVEVRREHGKGSLAEIRMVLAVNNQVTAIIRPQGAGTSLISVYILDQAQPLYQNVRVTIPLANFLPMPAYRMMELSAGRIRWDEIVWNRPADLFDSVRSIIKMVKPILPHLPDNDDGAMDEDGRIVKIGMDYLERLPGFNCSGFAKWLADGFYGPLAGGAHGGDSHGQVGGHGASASTAPYLRIEDLKKKWYDARGGAETELYEESRDPFFGLDWTRNIATLVAKARGQSIHGIEDRDVRDFVGEAYREDKGYPIEDLRQVLYVQAIKNPGRWYLGSINGEWGQKPTLWQHYHISAFFPYFDEAGIFRLTVFERNEDSSLADLFRRYPHTFVHLVWLSADGDFEPPHVDSDEPKEVVKTSSKPAH